MYASKRSGRLDDGLLEVGQGLLALTHVALDEPAHQERLGVVLVARRDRAVVGAVEDRLQRVLREVPPVAAVVVARDDDHRVFEVRLLGEGLLREELSARAVALDRFHLGEVGRQPHGVRVLRPLVAEDLLRVRTVPGAREEERIGADGDLVLPFAVYAARYASSAPCESPSRSSTQPSEYRGPAAFGALPIASLNAVLAPARSPRHPRLEAAVVRVLRGAGELLVRPRLGPTTCPPADPAD